VVVRRVGVACIAALAWACALAPAPADPSQSGVWGYVRLVPREGAPAGAGGGGYADRRYGDVQLVDYSRPGFAVVYVEGETHPGAPLALAIRSGVGGVRLEPAHAVLARGGEIQVANETDAEHAISCPETGLLRSLAPGESIALRAENAGELSLFVPDAPNAAARVFAAPGPFAAVSDAGRYALLDLAPGAHRLHAWHPRFPPAARSIELAPGVVARVDLELGVGLIGAERAE
jgi:hypothetical protein